MRNRTIRTVILFVISFAAFLAIWEGAVHLFQIRHYLLPPPTMVLARMAEDWERLWRHTVVTGSETLLGFGLAIGIGIPLAVIITYSRIAERFIYPALVASQVVPKIAVAPLFVVWFGFGYLPKILVAFLISFFPIVIDTVVGLKSTDALMLHLARSMGGGTVKTFLKIRLPNALPNIFAGLKVGITLAVVGAVTGEFIGGSSGLGYIVLLAAGTLDTPFVFASILLMTALGILLFALLEILERVMMPWRPGESLEESGRATM